MGRFGGVEDVAHAVSLLRQRRRRLRHRSGASSSTRRSGAGLTAAGQYGGPDGQGSLWPRRRGPAPAAVALVGRRQELELFSDTLIDPRAHGFVIHGPPGVGKTRLADQCLALADQAGRNVARATATEGSCEVPLGALAHLLPAGLGDERCDLVAVVSQIRSVLQDQSGTGPLVLFVDDLHLLDSTSATLVGQLVDADLLFLVATVRSTESVPRVWSRCGTRPGSGGSTSTTWTVPPSTRWCT